MELTDVLESKIFVKENNGIKFLSAKEYLDPFLDIVGPTASEITVRVADPVINQEIDSDEKNVAYPRVLVEANFGRMVSEQYDSVVGLVYGLDMQKPVIKTYAGHNVVACTNLTIFNAEMVFEQGLLGNYQEVYKLTQNYIDTMEKDLVDFRERDNFLRNTYLTQSETNRALGYMLRGAAKTRLGTTPILAAAKMIDNTKSKYYVDPHGECSLFNLYNACTQSITDSKEILDKANKTVILSNLIFSPNNYRSN